MKGLALARGRVFFLLLFMFQLAAANSQAQSFVRTGDMTTSRIGHTATLLEDGRVLVSGGAGSSAEIYDPVSGTFAQTGSMSAPRRYHGAALLGDGRVLLAGGCRGEPVDSCAVEFTSSAELYNPSTGTFTSTGNMSAAQDVSGAVLLRNGKVLVVGGHTAELYDPATGTFMLLTSTMFLSSEGLRIALLGDGTVLLAGVGIAAIYDPGNDGIRNIPLSWPFGSTTLTSLLDGTALFAGGSVEWEVSVTRSAVYDPATQTLVPKGDMVRPRSSVAALLKDGRVLVTGGYNGDGPDVLTGLLKTAEVYDPSTGTFSLLPDMTQHREQHTATLLLDGRVLITGGYGSQSRWPRGSNTSAELFIPGANSVPPQTLSSGAVTNLWTGWSIAGAGNFNDDGKADILWRNGGGIVAASLMNGASIARSVTIADIWTGWSIAGVGDFNGDAKADILWRAINGPVAMWLMNGTSIASYSAIADIWSGWSIAGVGDFNGDGKADILWRDTNGPVAMWLMNGTSVLSYNAIADIWTGWSIAAVADFDGDGRADILWRDSNGTVAMWMMNGTSVASYNTIGNIWTGWSIAGVGDFNGDGRADILWRDTSGTVAMWMMNGTRIASYSTIADKGTGWSIAGVEDFDGDRKADILWRDTSDSVEVWLMDGAQRRPQ